MLFKNKFPRIDKASQSVNFKHIFPWGCDQLNNDYYFKQGYYQIICLKTPYNLFLAYKYGIWTTQTMKQYATQHKQLFYVFLWRNMILGIAKVIKFCPQKSFKYWGKQQQNTFLGIIEIKFIKIGRVPFEKQSTGFLSFQQAKYIFKNLNSQQVLLNQLTKNDQYQQKQRQLMKQQSMLQRFHSYSNLFHHQFIIFNNKLKQLSSIRLPKKVSYELPTSYKNFQKHQSIDIQSQNIKDQKEPKQTI